MEGTRWFSVQGACAWVSSASPSAHAVSPRGELGAVSCGIRCRMCVCLYGNSTACRCLGWVVVGNMRVVGRWGNIWAVRVEVITHKSTATVGTSFTQTERF